MINVPITKIYAECFRNVLQLKGRVDTEEIKMCCRKAFNAIIREQIMEQEFNQENKISWNAIDGCYDGYDSEGKLVVVSEELYVSEWNAAVWDLQRRGYDQETAERAATYFLSHLEEWT